MIFKKLNLEFFSFTEENIDDIKKLLNKGLRKQRLEFKRNESLVNESGMQYDGLNDSIIDPDVFG